MKFSTKEDIEAPLEAVFEMMCDFETFERAAMRRGAEVQRTDTKTVPGVGMAWRAAFMLRGKRRQVELETVTFERPNEIVIECKSQGLMTHQAAQLVCAPAGAIAQAGEDIADQEIQTARGGVRENAGRPVQGRVT